MIRSIFSRIALSVVLALLLFSSLPTTLNAQQKQVKAVTIGFYNVENLFDTINQEGVNDEEFTPDGVNHYTGKRYMVKLNNLSDVISQIGTEIDPKGPMAMGVSEIENRSVLEDLVKMPKLAGRNYGIVHFDGPDSRGVDVGLIYRQDLLQVTSARSVRLRIPEMPDFKTRDQLVVGGVFDGQQIYIIVNHWPSRRGGQEASAHLRNAAASLVKKSVDSLYALNSNAAVLIMGDLNDDPVDASVVEYLGAEGKKNKVAEGGLFNPMWQIFKDGNGSLAYRDSWNLFDQIIVSKPLLNEKNKYRFYQARIFNKPFLLQKEGQFKGYPFRTYVGNDFKGGYSDHLPVYVILVSEAK
jgi:predicted extracellular nuclease